MADATQSASRPLELTELLTLMVEVSERINSTLDLDELMGRIAEIVKRAIDYEVFAILLLNEKTQELRIRFSIGHPEELVRNLRIKVGEGIVGRVAQTRRSVLVNDVLKDPSYIQSLPSDAVGVGGPADHKEPPYWRDRSGSRPMPDFFNDSHVNLLELLASRMAMALDNARLYRRSVRQARTLQLLNEISREMSSVLVLNELLRKIGTLTKRLIDYHRFSILLADEQAQTFNAVISLKQDEHEPEKVHGPFWSGNCWRCRRPPSDRRGSRCLQGSPVRPASTLKHARKWRSLSFTVAASSAWWTWRARS